MLTIRARFFTGVTCSSICTVHMEIIPWGMLPIRPRRIKYGTRAPMGRNSMVATITGHRNRPRHAKRNT